MKNIYKIILLCLLTSVLCPSTSFSQTAPGIEWQKCLGGTDDDVAFSIQQTTDGGYIVAGETRSNDGDVTGNHGDADYWVVKLDTTGNIQWQKCLGGTDLDQAFSIGQSADGGYVVAGTSFSSDGDVTGNIGITDYWVVKLNTTGNIQWQKSLGGYGTEDAFSVQQTADGGYVVTGTTSSNDSEVTGNHGAGDYWAVKLDTSGIIQWQKCLGGTNSEDGRSIHQTADGGYVVAGWSSSNDGDVTGHHGFAGIVDTSDCWLVKLDTAGNIQWQKSFGGTNFDYAFSVQQTTDGGYVMAGRTHSDDGDITGHHGIAGTADDWVVKLDPTGNIQWQKCLGGTGDDAAYSIWQTADGGYVVAGWSASNDGDVTGNQGYDYWVVKLDAAGVIQWQKCMGGTYPEEAYSIQQTSDGGYVVAGVTSSIDGDVTGNHGNLDCWVVKLGPDTITSIFNIEHSIFNIIFSPNPLTTQSKLTFKNPNKEKFLFTLYDITGRMTESVSTTNNEIILTKGSKPAGVYLFNLVNEKAGERWNGKIVIAN